MATEIFFTLWPVQQELMGTEGAGSSSALLPHLSQLGGTCSGGGGVCLAFNLPLARCYWDLPPWHSAGVNRAVCPVHFAVVRLENV